MTSSATSAPAPSLALLAGSAVQMGSADGAGIDARFQIQDHGPIAADGAGDLFVADAGTIRRITPGGVVSTLHPGGAFPFVLSTIGIGATGALYWGSFTCGDFLLAAFCTGHIGKIGPAGEIVGIGPPISSPWALAIDGAGNIHVADVNAHVIRKISPEGDSIMIVGTGVAGHADGIASAAGFDHPEGIAIDSAGNIIVADAGSHTIRKIAPGGSVTTLAGSAGLVGSADGPGISARFSAPQGIALDHDDNIYVADTANSTVRKITPSGVVSTVAGTAGVKGFTPGPLPGVLNSPLGVAVVGSDLYVTMQSGVAVVHNRP